ncbi:MULTISPECIES: WXG100 family type VII secretion target [Actinosynnema]|uniref:WXG100 family type VII secretion target n=1 Tax=Actinosynnema TaxID=40566 RepID=UPI0020A40B5E|nr:hypothetical protein [Actinosynnema pretiosum]MCP2095297.1 Protein of unknown function (DUF2580) [Actinosynnema pretiosum]
MAGYGVSPADLQKVAGQYEDHGTDIIQMSSGLAPGVGAGQVGRKFQGVAATYKAYFDRLQENVNTFGRGSNNVAQRLKDVANSYQGEEQGNASRFGG